MDKLDPFDINEQIITVRLDVTPQYLEEEDYFQPNQAAKNDYTGLKRGALSSNVKVNNLSDEIYRVENELLKITEAINDLIDEIELLKEEIQKLKDEIELLKQEIEQIKLRLDELENPAFGSASISSHIATVSDGDSFTIPFDTELELNKVLIDDGLKVTADGKYSCSAIINLDAEYVVIFKIGSTVLYQTSASSVTMPTITKTMTTDDILSIEIQNNSGSQQTIVVSDSLISITRA